MDLMLATSKAGHDQKKVYVVIDEVEDYFILANGTTKTLPSLRKRKKFIYS